ncbi:hypothetical protein DP117_31000 [Brasilonema sp. UFV-L1]|nr:hypothetical protein [Brasilonema sp. UFV-L1]
MFLKTYDEDLNPVFCKNCVSQEARFRRSYRASDFSRTRVRTRSGSGFRIAICYLETYDEELNAVLKN